METFYCILCQINTCVPSIFLVIFLDKESCPKGKKIWFIWKSSRYRLKYNTLRQIIFWLPLKIEIILSRISSNNKSSFLCLIIRFDIFDTLWELQNNTFKKIVRVQFLITDIPFMCDAVKSIKYTAHSSLSFSIHDLQITMLKYEICILSEFIIFSRNIFVHSHVVVLW